MPRPSPLVYLPLLRRALEAEIGICFKISGVDRRYFTNTLSECRKQAAATDPQFEGLIMFMPAGGREDEIFIAKKEVELD